MEAIGPNKLQQRSLQVERTANNPIPVEKQRAMGDVFDRWRINQGWNPWDNNTQDMAIASFVHTLDAEGVPAAAYSQLYERVLKSRVTAIQAGKQLPSFGVELLLAEWLGPYGLKAEWKRREIDAGRTLTSTAQSQCLDCFGTGTQIIQHPDGTREAKLNCPHAHRADEPEISDFSRVDEVLNRPIPDETAEQICSRIRIDLAKMYAMAGDAETSTTAWEASRTWAHAERYCRENQE